jgi:protein-S-isoprenylcysteine O-methyltransferase Ste14
MTAELQTALKTVVFTVLVPGTVTILLPYLILRERAGPVSLKLPEICGVLLITIGVAIYLSCAFSFVRFGRGTPAPIDPPTELVVQGMYRFSRNPMYVGVVTVLLGESLLFRSSLLLIYTAVVFIAFNIFIMWYEEPTLQRMFGESYDSYRRRVPRWVGRVLKD